MSSPIAIRSNFLQYEDISSEERLRVHLSDPESPITPTILSAFTDGTNVRVISGLVPYVRGGWDDQQGQRLDGDMSSNHYSDLELVFHHTIRFEKPLYGSRFSALVSLSKLTMTTPGAVRADSADFGSKGISFSVVKDAGATVDSVVVIWTLIASDSPLEGDIHGAVISGLPLLCTLSPN